MYSKNMTLHNIFNCGKTEKMVLCVIITQASINYLYLSIPDEIDLHLVNSFISHVYGDN